MTEGRVWWVDEKSGSEAVEEAGAWPTELDVTGA